MDPNNSSYNQIDLDDSISQFNQSSFSMSDKNSQNLEEQLRKSNESVQKLKNAYIQIKKMYDAKSKQNEELKLIVNQYLDENKKQKVQLDKIQAKIMIDSVIWFLGKNENGQEWVKQDDNLNDEEIINYNTIKQERLEIKKKEKNLEQDLQNCINQFEQRGKRVQTLFEESEAKVDELNEKIKQLNKNYDKGQTMVAQLIDRSENILQNTQQFLNEENDTNTKNECLNKMKYLLANLQETELDGNLDQAKDHILVLHQTVFEIMKKFNQCEQDQNEMEKQFRHKINLLTLEKEKEQKQSNLYLKQEMEVLEQGKKRIKELEQLNDQQQYDSQKTIKELNLKMDFLNQELKKNVNTQYIKNIIIKFFNSDYIVQERTINVIATVLQFTNQETDDLRKSWQSQVSIQSSISSFGQYLKNGINNLKPQQ